MANRDEGAREVIYLNGRFQPLDEARISPLDRGFLYGDGVFTTMRAEQGQVLYLKDHLTRLNQSFAELKLPISSLIDWQPTLADLLRKNGLENDVASVKILVSRGQSSLPGLPNPAQATVVIYARRYEPASASIYCSGYRLQVFRDAFSPPLSRLKSLNYLCHLMARQAAMDAGADEAVMLDAQGRLAETSAGSLILRTQGKWWTPRSDYQLPGITLRHVIRILGEAGLSVACHSADATALYSAETVWVLNSLIGVMPVAQVDHEPLAKPSPEEADRLRAQLFERGR